MAISRTALSTLLLLAILTTSCGSQVVTQNSDHKNLSKKELISKVFEIKKMKQSYDQTTLSNLTASFESGPSAALMFDQQKKDITIAMADIIQEHHSWNQIAENIYYPLYDSLYTKDELLTLIPILESDSYKLLVERDLSMISDATKLTHEMTSELLPLFTETIMEIMGSGEELNPMPSPKQN